MLGSNPSPEPVHQVLLEISPESTTFFSSLLRGGFWIPAPEGLSVRRFLGECLGLPADYIEHRISTVFLDGKPVDDVDQASVCGGSALSLSAAMPGIAGITMRRYSPVAALRADITHRPALDESAGPSGMVLVKTFNLIAVELGPGLLARGIGVAAAALARWMEEWLEELERAGGKARMAGRPMELSELSDRLTALGDELVWVKGTVVGSAVR